MHLFVPFHWCALFQGVCTVPAYHRWPKDFTPAQRDFSPWGQMWGTVFSWQDMKCSRGLRNNSCGASLRQTFEVPQACKSQNISWTRPKLPSTDLSHDPTDRLFQLIHYRSYLLPLVFIWWRTLDSFHQTHRRPNASGVQIHENYLSFIYSHCLVLPLQFSSVMRQ